MDKGRLFRIICGVMIALIAGILVVMFVSDDAVTAEYSTDLSKDYADTSSWMEHLSDDIYVSQITLPGTHGSGARNVVLGYSKRCQNTSISEQLEDGYRFLDLRVAIEETEDGDKLRLVNDSVDCHASGGIFSNYLYFDDTVEDIYKFLQQHPTETIILSVNIEDTDYPIKDIQKLLLTQIKSNKDYWYTDNQIPTLGDVRGRIILATRFNDEAASEITGLNLIWNQQDNRVAVDIPYELYVNDDYRFWVQDRYNYSVEDKYEAVVDGLENCEADENTLFINFVSTSGDGKIGHPYGYAQVLNGFLMEYELKSETSYGIVVVDFGTADLARHIYYSNF